MIESPNSPRKCVVFVVVVLGVLLISLSYCSGRPDSPSPLIVGGIFVTSFSNPAEVYFVATIRNEYLKSTLSTIKNLVANCTPCLGYSGINVCELNMTMPDDFVNGLEIGSDYSCAQSFGPPVPCPWTLPNNDVCLCSIGGEHMSQGGVAVNCSNMGLTSVPVWNDIAGFPGHFPFDSAPGASDIQDLFLSGNNITSIGATAFLLSYGYIMILGQLDLSFNKIQSIDVNAFSNPSGGCVLAEDGDGNLCNNSLPLLSTNCSNPLCDEEHSVYQALCMMYSFLSTNGMWACGIADTPYGNCCCSMGRFEYCHTGPESCCGRPGPCSPNVIPKIIDGKHIQIN